MHELTDGDLTEREVAGILSQFEDAKVKDILGLVDYYIDNPDKFNKPKQAEKELGIPAPMLRALTASMVFQRYMQRRMFALQFTPEVWARSFSLLVKHATSAKTSPRDVIAILRYAADLMGVETRQRVDHNVNVNGGVKVVFEVPIKPDDVFTVDPAEVIEADALPVPSEDSVVQRIRESTGEGTKALQEAKV